MTQEKKRKILGKPSKMAPNPQELCDPIVEVKSNKKFGKSTKVAKSSNLSGVKQVQLTVEGSGHEHEYVWTLSDELAELALKELGENKEVRDSSLKSLRNWIKNHPEISNCRTDNVFLLRFLRSQKFRLERTQTVLENYLRMRCENPDWFTDLDPTLPHVEEMSDSGFSLVLPNRDASGRRVLLSYVSKIDLNKHKNSHVMRSMMVNLETLMADEENQIRGISYIFYCKALSLAHLSIWTPAEANRLFGTCEKNLGVRHSDINLVRMPFTMWAVIEFVKQFLSSKIKSRIHTFSDEKKLAQKLGNSKMLPEELGGNGKSLLEMSKRWKQELWQHRNYLLALDNMTIDSSSSNEKSDDESDSQESQTSSGFMNFLL